MKSLEVFDCRSAKIEIKMAELKDDLRCLYIVSEKPKKKNQGWNESTFIFINFKDANAKFLELVKFWCL